MGNKVYIPQSLFPYLILAVYPTIETHCTHTLPLFTEICSGYYLDLLSAQFGNHVIKRLSASPPLEWPWGSVIPTPMGLYWRWPPGAIITPWKLNGAERMLCNVMKPEQINIIFRTIGSSTVCTIRRRFQAEPFKKLRIHRNRMNLHVCYAMRSTENIWVKVVDRHSWFLRGGRTETCQEHEYLCNVNPKKSSWALVLDPIGWRFQVCFAITTS